MFTRPLSDPDFQATFRSPMRNVTADASIRPIDVWPYIRNIPTGELSPFHLGDNDVELVYRSGDGRFDHVIIPTLTENVKLVVVVDVVGRAVFGHHVLNLNEKYGLPTPLPGA